MHWGQIFAQIIGDGRSTKVAKIMVVHWRLTFLRRGQVCSPMHLYRHKTFVRKNVENFKWLLLWSLWASVAQISYRASFGQGNERLLKWTRSAKLYAVQWPSWPPCPNMVKIYINNLLLQNRGCLWTESLHKLSGTGGLPILLKWWSYIDVWSFYGEVKFASGCFCLGHIHLYGKNVDSFKWLLLWSLRANVA